MGLDQNIYRLMPIDPNIKVKKKYGVGEIDKLLREHPDIDYFCLNKGYDEDAKSNFETLSNIGTKTIVTNTYINFPKCVLYKLEKYPKTSDVEVFGMSSNAEGNIELSGIIIPPGISAGIQFHVKISNSEIEDENNKLRDFVNESAILYKRDSLNYWRGNNWLQEEITSRHNCYGCNCRYVPLRLDDIESIIDDIKGIINNWEQPEDENGLSYRYGHSKDDFYDMLDFFEGLIRDEDITNLFYYDWW